MIFLYAKLEEFNNYCILPDLQSPSNYTPLLISIIIKEEFIQERKQTIVKNSEEEKEFINELRIKISSIDITNVLNNNILEWITQEFAIIAKDL